MIVGASLSQSSFLLGELFLLLFLLVVPFYLKLGTEGTATGVASAALMSKLIVSEPCVSVEYQAQPSLLIPPLGI